METHVESLFAAWEGFYVIVGTSAAALTGLMFVVITLLADSQRRRTLPMINAFATPTVVHFTAVVALSAGMAAPWSGAHLISTLLALLAVAGLVYVAIVLRRLRRDSEDYKPVKEDWIWHVIVPAISYLVLFASHVGIRNHLSWAPYVVGAVSVALLADGIHNSWDMVTYMVATEPREKA